MKFLRFTMLAYLNFPRRWMVYKFTLFIPKKKIFVSTKCFKLCSGSFRNKAGIRQRNLDQVQLKGSGCQKTKSKPELSKPNLYLPSWSVRTPYNRFFPGLILWRLLVPLSNWKDEALTTWGIALSTTRKLHHLRFRLPKRFSNALAVAKAATPSVFWWSMKKFPT